MKRKKIHLPLLLVAFLFVCAFCCAIPAVGSTKVIRSVSGVIQVSEAAPISPITPIEPIQPIESMKPMSEITPVMPVEPIREARLSPPEEWMQSNAQVPPNSGGAEDTTSTGSATNPASQLPPLPAGEVSSSSSAPEKGEPQATPAAIFLTVVLFFAGFSGALFAINPELRQRLFHKKHTGEKEKFHFKNNNKK